MADYGYLKHTPTQFNPETGQWEDFDPDEWKSFANIGLGASGNRPAGPDFDKAMRIFYGLDDPSAATPQVSDYVSRLHAGEYSPKMNLDSPVWALSALALPYAMSLALPAAAGGASAGGTAAGGTATGTAAGGTGLTAGAGGITGLTPGAGAAGITAAPAAGTSLAPGFFAAESLGPLASGASILGNSGASGGAVNGSIIPGVPNNLLGAGVGALLGGVGGSQAGTTTTVEDIPEWLKPFALQGMQGLSEAYGQTPDGMSPITAAGGQYMQDVIGGDYLNSNPYLDAMFNQAAGKVTSGVNSQFSGAGRYGSGAHQGVLGESLGNLATDIYGQNFARERGFQQQAAQGAPDFGTASILQPFAKSQALLQGLGNIRGGTTTSPYFRNRPAEILSGALGGASLFS